MTCLLLRINLCLAACMHVGMHVQLYMCAHVNESRAFYVWLNFDPDKISLTGYDFSWSSYE